MFSYPVDIGMHAQPLYVQSVTVGKQGVHNVVYVVTEHDSVYAFDADGKASTPLWHVSFINPSTGITTVPQPPGDEAFPAGEIGITSPPAIDPATGWDIWLLRPAGQPKLDPFLQTPANERGAVLSPDGLWLAYEPDQTGRQEVYVRSMADHLANWQVSTDGGTEPMWARNGQELFYRAAAKMMSVSIRTEPTFCAGKPQLLFEAHYETGNGFVANYDVDSPGQREASTIRGDHPR